MDSVASVGSYTSEASRVSGHSDEVWDYLSEQERECLKFLEETIDSLNIEELEQTETVLTRNGSQLEKVPQPYPESLPSQVAERAGKIPRAVLPLGPSTPGTTPANVLESKSGSNTLPKSGWRGGGESGRLESSAGEGRRRSLTTPAHPSSGARDERGKHGPPTAPKPGRLPQNIVLRSYHQSNGPHPQSIYKVSQDGGRGNGHSKDSSTEVEAQHVRHQALAKLGLLSETDGIRRNRPESVKVPGGSRGPAGDEKITGHPGADIELNKHPDPRGLSVGSGSDANLSTAIVGAGNASRLHWQHPASTSASLKRFSTPGDTSFPSARYASTNTALAAGTSKTLPNVKRSVNVGDGLARNSSLTPWVLGPSKASSLKRFGTSGDNSQPPAYPGHPRTAMVTAAPGPHKLPKPRPMSVCSEADLSARLGNALEGTSPEKPAGRFFPKIHHISAKPHRSPPKGLNVQSAPQKPSTKDHKDALRKLGLLKE